MKPMASTEKTIETDVAIIGAGTAGLAAYRAVKGAGKRALLIEGGERLATNQDVFEWEELPESVAVFGPGVIGLELGQALHRLGVRVKIFGRGGRVGPLSHPALIDYARKVFGEELYLDTNAHAEVRREGDEVVVTYRALDGTKQSERVSHLVAATGRTPNVGKLALENTTLALDARG